MRGRGFAHGLALAGALALGVPQAAGAAQGEDPDWPCIQRQMPAISPGMVWTGPSIDELASDWHDDEELAALVRRVVARRTPTEEAKALIGGFAGGLGPDKNDKLTMVFAGALDQINAERGGIIEGIKRYSRRQRAMAERIEARAARITDLAAETGDAARRERRTLEEEQVWDARVFEEREHSLTYVCESPVLLEQRLFQIARELMSHLD